MPSADVSPSPTPVGTGGAAATVTWNQGLMLVVILCAAVLLAGLVVMGGRKLLNQKDSEGSLVRSWLAVTLVIGLLVFCAVSFTVADTSVRSTLIGAVAASAGAAVAYYFSSKASDSTRQDILDAAFGLEEVPDLAGLSVDAATSALGTTGFSLKVDAKSPADGTAVVSQAPTKDTSVRKGSAVTVTLGPPPAAAAPAPGAVPVAAPAPAPAAALAPVAGAAPAPGP